MGKSSNRSSYTSKNIPQRTAYQKYIRTTERQPTVDENFPFDTTLQQGEELSEATSKRKRSIPATKILEEHFKKHWVEWAIGIFILVSLSVYVDTGKAIAVLETKLVNQKELIEKTELTSESNNSNQSRKNDDVDSSIDSLEKENSLQDLIINELKLRLGILEDKINNAIVTPRGQP